MNNYLATERFQEGNFLSKNGYLLKTFLGKGQFGTVWKAKRKRDGNEIAVKKILLKALDTEKLRKAMNNEIRIMQECDHKNIVKFFGFEKSKDSIFIYMEFCKLGDLTHYIENNNGQLNDFIIRKFIRDIASGIQHMYSKGIVHRDLKMDNIFVSSDLTCKIGDFGLARKVSTFDLATSYCGTPFYMSPEILVNNQRIKGYHHYVDLWSLGILLYQMIYGQFPFSATSIEELTYKVGDASYRVDYPPRNSNGIVPSEAIDLMKKLLERNSKKRITFDKFFSHPYVNISKKQLDVAKKKIEDLNKEKIEISKSINTVVSLIMDGKLKNLEDNSHIECEKREKDYLDLIETNSQIAITLNDLSKLFYDANNYYYALIFALESHELFSSLLGEIKNFKGKRGLKITNIVIDNICSCRKTLENLKKKLKTIQKKDEKNKFLDANVVLYMFCIKLMKEVGYNEYVNIKKKINEECYKRGILLLKHLINFVQSADKIKLQCHITKIKEQQEALGHVK